jgi:hypothetical protein
MGFSVSPVSPVGSETLQIVKSLEFGTQDRGFEPESRAS